MNGKEINGECFHVYRFNDLIKLFRISSYSCPCSNVVCINNCCFCHVVTVVADNRLIVCFPSIFSISVVFFFQSHHFLTVTISLCRPVADAAASAWQQMAS